MTEPAVAPATAIPLRDRLLGATLENAWTKGFYRDHWRSSLPHDPSGPPPLPRSIQELQALPLLDRETYRSSYMHTAPDTCDGTFISHTKGTSGQDLLWRYRTRGEQQVIASLFGKTSPGPTRMVLSLRWPQHGMGMPVPGPSIVIPGNPYSENGMHQALRVLESVHQMGATLVRPTVLSGHADHVAKLAELVLREGAVERLAIAQIHMAGDLEPSRFARVRQAFPGAATRQKFSLSEIFGGAWRTCPTDPYQLDAYVIGEVVGTDGRHVAQGDVGELVMTELFPFVQHQPLVRYRTGDLVRRMSASDSDLSFDYVGRITAPG